jgi:hypothetical protein
MKLIIFAFFVAVASAAPSAEPSAAAIPGPGPVPAAHPVAAPAAAPEASQIPIAIPKAAPQHASPNPAVAVKSAASLPSPAHASPAHASPSHSSPSHASPSHASAAPGPIAAVKSAPHSVPAPVASELGAQGSIGAPEPIVAAIAEQTEQVQPAAIAVPSSKQLLYVEPILKTPASTAKLAPLGGTYIQPIAPLTYSAAPSILAPFPAWNGLAAIPATYSIEQHGYHITY